MSEDVEAETTPAPKKPSASEALLNEGDIVADYLEELLDIADLDGDIENSVVGGRAHVAIDTEDERLVGMKERLANSEEMKKRLLERFDEDKDGELSDAELKKAMAAFGERRPGGRPGGEGKPGERPERKPGERPERKPKAEAGE